MGLSTLVPLHKDLILKRQLGGSVQPRVSYGSDFNLLTRLYQLVCSSSKGKRVSFLFLLGCTVLRCPHVPLFCSYDLLVQLAKGFIVKPCHTSWEVVQWALQTPALGIMAQWVKMYNFCRNNYPVITAVLTDTRGLDPSTLVVIVDDHLGIGTVH